jgi:hypothetical protein
MSCNIGKKQFFHSPFVAFLAFVGALASVRSQMNLQVGQLAKGFGAFLQKSKILCLISSINYLANANFALVACSAIHLLGVPELKLPI